MGERVRASEKGLALDSTPDEFAAAMMKCQCPVGSCMYRGECFYDGECFRSDASARRTALRLLNDLASQQPAAVAAWINAARQGVLAMDPPDA